MSARGSNSLAEEPIPEVRSGAGGHENRQAVQYCPYCAEETLFPLEQGWECRSCRRAFSVRFLGLRSGTGAEEVVP